MSPTSFQTAPPRVNMNLTTQKNLRCKEWVEVDSNHRSNLQQIYSLSPLATRESTHNNMLLSALLTVYTTDLNNASR